MKKKHVVIAALALLGCRVFAKELIKPVASKVLEKIVQEAPQPPAEAIDLGLKMRLIDYIDCTNPDDPHDFMDQGTSKIVKGPAGTYRLSAGHKHGFFSYGYKTQGADKPVLIVVEYPDDAVRRFSFMTHDSMRPGRAHWSFSMEAGVYTGKPLPQSGQMHYFTLLNWPQDDWSPLIAMSYQRTGGGAAASKIWVYAVDEIEPLAIETPEPENERQLDMFIALAFLATRDNFGWESPEAIDHMVDYCKMTGINRVTMMLYGNQLEWGTPARVPAWDVPEDRGLDNILTRMDKKGGVGLIFGIVADGMYGDVKQNDKIIRDLPSAEKKAALLKGFDEIIDYYGHYKSFKGFSLGSLEAGGFYDTLNDAGLLEEVIAHIHQRRPDLEVISWLGCAGLQRPYFKTKKTAHSHSYPATPAHEVILGWEKSGQPWDRYVGDVILNQWKSWNYDPADMGAISGLNVYEKKAPDDHRIAAEYSNEPREALYYDIANSQYKSDLVDTRYGAIFSYFDEGWAGLSKGYNFWYDKLWTGPDFNGPGPQALAPWSMLMTHRDRQAITAGSWSIKYFGTEIAMRRFAKAFRALPPVELKTIIAGVPDHLRLRWIVHKGKRYINVISQIPFASVAKIEGKTIALRPYDMVTLVDDGKQAPAMKAETPLEYTAWVRERIDRFNTLTADVRALDSEAAPDCYDEVARHAQELLNQGAACAANQYLAFGLEEELRFRCDLLAPPAMTAPRYATAEGLADSPLYRADTGEFLQGHNYLPNSWHGPDDLSAGLRFAHDQTNLYFVVDVKDSVTQPKDACIVWLSFSGYRDWKSGLVKPDIEWEFQTLEDTGTGDKGLQWKTTAVDGGYRIEASAPLKQLGLTPGDRVGFLLTVQDMDGMPGVDLRKKWARKQIMHIPCQPNFAMWEDARNCGELILEK